MGSKGINKRKKKGLKRFKNSFKYSIAGLKYAYLNEQSLWIHTGVTILVIIFGLIFHLRLVEWLLCLIMIGFILAAELLNTAIEATVDMAMPDIHPYAKIAKDTASAAVFVLSVVAFIIGLVIFIPKILGL